MSERAADLVYSVQQEEMRNNVPEGSNIRFIFPPMEGAATLGVMHSKLQLLKYDKYLRVVVPTGNLVPYDWGETGNMENVLQNMRPRILGKLLTYYGRWCF